MGKKVFLTFFNLGKNHTTFFNQLYILDIRYTDDSMPVTYTSGAGLAVCPSLNLFLATDYCPWAVPR